MRMIKATVLLAAFGVLAACEIEDVGDMGFDHGIDSGDVGSLQAGIWVDPNGCDHWIIDDGFEGYLSQRLDAYGRPVCSGIAPPNTATGPFKSGSNIPDPI